MNKSNDKIPMAIHCRLSAMKNMISVLFVAADIHGMILLPLFMLSTLAIFFIAVSIFDSVVSSSFPKSSSILKIGKIAIRKNRFPGPSSGSGEYSHCLLVQFHVDLTGNGFERPYRVADDVQLLVLSLHHALLQRGVLAEEMVRGAVERRGPVVAGTVEGVLELRVLCAAVSGHCAGDCVREAGSRARSVRSGAVQVVRRQPVSVALEQWLARCDVAVSIPVQTQLLLHRLHFVARRIDEVAPRVQFLLVDFKFAQILLDDRYRVLQILQVPLDAPQ